MSTETLNKPGSLIKYRNREWIVLPSDDADLMLMKPLGGSDEEVTAIYLPLEHIPGEKPEPSKFAYPTADDLGSFETAKVLFDASRLSFRNASGPFRCMGKLSFRPRSYQLVPLVMALKQKEVVRMMIADDVGIGKTIEALVILKELMERGDVKNFAVICPPHLCEQWQKELKDKLDIEAEIIRSSTAAALDRKLPDDRSVFFHMPYQVISIDYIKADKRRGIFLTDCPQFIIIDEAHTCALPAGAKSKSQQQRYALIYDISQQPDKHMLLLTATPHSGKDEEFISLLGLLNKEFSNLDFNQLDKKEKEKDKEKIAKQFIQRKREKIKVWLKESTPFPERDSKELPYQLHPDYQKFYKAVLDFAKGISKDTGRENTMRIRYWAALALLRGVMSSPEAGLEMLQNRQNKKLGEEELKDIQDQDNPHIEKLSFDTDSSQTEIIDYAELESSELQEIQALCEQIKELSNLEKDKKAQKAIKIIKDWLSEEFHPIIFCKYIATARYLGKILKDNLPQKVNVEVVTSELADEQRKEKIEQMGEHDKRVLIATDCLSEGINLQEFFTAVLHYDLPWNPNRIEQRDGRVDRFGQDAPLIKSYILWGEDNPIDNIVLKILIRKVREIQKATGVSIIVGEDNTSIMDTILKEVLLKEESTQTVRQLTMFDDKITNELQSARQKAENLRSIFAHETIKAEMIEADLKDVDEAIGDITSVETFVINAITHLKGTINKDEKGYLLYPQNIPPHLKFHFGNETEVKISFDSPTPKGYRYIGRNHLFVEQLCQFILALAFDGHNEYPNMARVAEIQTNHVNTKTTLIMFRVRNVIKEVSSKKEVIAEEMYLWGYEGTGQSARSLDYSEAKKLLLEASSIRLLSEEKQKDDINRELTHFETLKPRFLELAVERAENLIKAHGRFKELVGGRRYEKATPILPPDVMGIYILMPQPKTEL